MKSKVDWMLDRFILPKDHQINKCINYALVMYMLMVFKNIIDKYLVLGIMTYRVVHVESLSIIQRLPSRLLSEALLGWQSC